ncbi:MAG: patatin-like phospholipase family protein [Terracidiphilus sp.]|nr:patatin-like phospholipase family protein [Terracidiphilus sp.]MDR3777387.1 patatin-like phospholipase family protein [Terracidiphilus sp.]
MPWKCAAFLITITLLAAPAWGQPSSPAQQDSAAAVHASLPAITPAGRSSIGVALEGGGALGLAHVGVLQWFEEHRIPVDRIAGTSMGALVGGLYATGDSPAEMRAIAVSNAFLGVFTLQTAYTDSSYRRREDRHEVPQAITFGLKHGVGMRNALLSDRGVNAFLVTNMPAYNLQELDYNRMPIPFRCVATDLTTLQPIDFSSGPLPQAVRASISIPGVFPPVEDRNGHFLVDGGILDNLPTDVLKRDLHADIVIAVRLEDAALSGADTGSIVGVLNRAFSAGIVRNVEQAEHLADVVVKVPVGNFSGIDYGKAAELIKAGYQAAEQRRATLLPFALDAEGWKAHLAARESRRLALPGALRQVRVVNGEPGAIRQVLADMKPLNGQPVLPGPTLEALKPIQSNGDYDATYETFSPTPGSTTVPSPDTGVLVRLSKDPTGPPYLLFGPDMGATTSNITRMEMTFRLVDQNLGGFGSELRAGAQLGYKTQLSAEYYRLLSPSGYFVEPRIGLLRQPVYIWANQKRIAERFEQNLAAGIEAGRTFSNRLQISAEWRAEDTRWSLKTGSDGGAYLSGTAQTGLLHFNLDGASSGVISPNGYRIAASVGSLYHAAGSSNAPLVNLTFSRTLPYNAKNILILGGDIHSYFRANVAQPYRFTLGGPLRLSASSFDEFRGTDTFLARAGYMHRIAALPTGLGQGLYAVFGYEAGEIWSPEQRSILRQDGTTGVIASTPVGVISVGVSVGDAGHRKVFVTLGRLF